VNTCLADMVSGSVKTVHATVCAQLGTVRLPE